MAAAAEILNQRKEEIRKAAYAYALRAKLVEVSLETLQMAIDVKEMK